MYTYTYIYKSTTYIYIYYVIFHGRKWSVLLTFRSSWWGHVKNSWLAVLGTAKYEPNGLNRVQRDWFRREKVRPFGWGMGMMGISAMANRGDNWNRVFQWIYSGFTHWKWWFNGILLGYPLVPPLFRFLVPKSEAVTLWLWRSQFAMVKPWP